MAHYGENLRMLIEKLLMYRGRRFTTCRVFPPSPGSRVYSLILEESGIREQFYLDAMHVEQFAKTGNDQQIMTDIRAALRNLDRQLMKKKLKRD